MSWYVLYSKSRYEIKTANTLEKMGIQVYCPVIKEVRQWSDRKKTITKPLFSSYFFVKLNEHEREKVFEVTGIVRFVYWLGKPALISDKEIETIRDWLEGGQMEKIEVTGLTPGEIIKLNAGVFKDQEAKIIDIGKTKMRLILLALGCTVTVSIKEVMES
ncbi:MAG: UpxY family transcription antiterminator [Gillisia sp.]